MKQTIALASAALLLAACGERETEPAEPAPEPTETSTPAVQGQSIIRPDIEEVKDVPLEPLALTIGFPDGGAELDEDGQSALLEVVEAQQFQSGGAIILRGHTDSSGRDDANMSAAQARAEAVRDFLIEQGAQEGRFTIIAFGEQNPLEPNALPDGSPNEEGRALNRRVDVTIDPEPKETESAPDQPAEG